MVLKACCHRRALYPNLNIDGFISGNKEDISCIISAAVNDTGDRRGSRVENEVEEEDEDKNEDEDELEGVIDDDKDWT